MGESRWRRVVGRWVPQVRERAVITATVDDLQRLLTGTLGAYTPPLRRDGAGMLAAYSRVPQLRTAFARLATGCAAVPWHLHGYAPSENPDGPYVRHRALQRMRLAARERTYAQLKSSLIPVTDHPFYDLIDGSELFAGGLLVRLTCLHLGLAGDAYWYKQRDSLRTPVAAFPIPPYWVTRHPSLDDSDPFYEITLHGKTIRVPRSEIIRFTDPDPLNPYGRGVGPGAALGDETNTGEAISKHLSAFYHNYAVPPMVIMPDQPIGGFDAADKLHRKELEWIEKTQSRFRRGVPYFSNIKLHIKELSGKFNEMQMAELLQLNWGFHRRVLGMSPEILGDTTNANRSTMTMAYEFHARMNMVPFLDYLCRKLQTDLIERDYDERLILSYESPVDKDSEYRKNLLAYVPEAFTVNQIMEMAHFPLIPGAAGELRIMRKGARFGRLVETPDSEAVGDPEMDPPPLGNGHDEEAQAIMDEHPQLRQALAAYTDYVTSTTAERLNGQRH